MNFLLHSKSARTVTDLGPISDQSGMVIWKISDEFKKILIGINMEYLPIFCGILIEVLSFMCDWVKLCLSNLAILCKNQRIY